nr:Chain A, Alpha-synuclein [Homo sapiens]
GVVHGVTTVA